MGNGTSGGTYYGLLAYIDTHKPSMVMFENVEELLDYAEILEQACIALRVALLHLCV